MDSFMTALAAALSLQDKVEQYGSYAGVAAVFGLGVLSLLYFAQAREVKRLREWAGRAPERAAELEARAIAAAEEKLAVPEPAEQPAAAVAPVPAAAAASAAASGNGAAAPVAAPEVAPVPSVPASAPGAPARAPGAPMSPPAAAPAAAPAAGARAATATGAPGGPGGGAPASAGGATAVLPAPAPAVAAATAAPAAPPVNGGGAVTPPVGPAPATAAGAGRAPAPPAPRSAPLRTSTSQATVPPRTAAGAARAVRPRGTTGGRSRGTLAGMIALGAAIVVGLVVVGLTVLGGNDDKPPATPNTVAPPASASTTAGAGNASSNAGAAAPAKVNRGQVRVAVLNGTTFTGLARSASDKLTKAGFQPGVVTNDTTNQARSATAVFFASGQKNAALEVAKIVGIPRDAVQKLDANTRGVAGEDADVVVSVGADQAR